MDRVENITRRVLFVVLGGTFLMAGLLKAWHPVEFAKVLRYLVGDGTLGYGSRMIGVAALATWEVGLGVMLIAQQRGRRVLLTTLGTLLVFTVALASMMIRPNPPSCGCLSVPVSSSGKGEYIIGLVRNIALLWMTVWLLNATRFSVDGKPKRRQRVAHESRPSGFTLIELLVVLATIAVLISIILPSLSGSRQAARDVARVATLREVHSAVSAYSIDHAGILPYIQQPWQPFFRRTLAGHEFVYDYFTAQKWLWANAIWPDYFAGGRNAIEREEVRNLNRMQRGFPEQIIVSEYFLTFNAAATPAFWTDRAFRWHGLAAIRELRPMAIDDVRFHSQKGLLIYGEGFNFADDRERAFVATADGAARIHHVSEFRPDAAIARPFGAFNVPVMSTRDGLNGRDY
ncbi:MAG: type II secretion system protein [Phycisphaeraceae bacterium]|nr:type II secretion system protein [Phycisphaeraceae bacterium]